MPEESDNLSWNAVRSSRRWSSSQASWVIAKLKRSGLSAERFARKHRVSSNRLSYWRQRLKEPAGPARTGLIEIVSPSSTAKAEARGSERIEIELVNGCQLRVSESISLDTLAKLVSRLQNMTGGC